MAFTEALALFVASVLGGGQALYDAACAGSIAAERAGRVRPPALDEISGIAASRARPGVLWVHEDSGGDPRLFALDVRGRLRQTVNVRGAENVDWEDLAIGPGPRGRDSLYVADIGDNLRVRRAVVVYRLAEPSPGARSAAATRIELRYPDGPHDAEALLVDPLRPSLVIVTKGLGRAVVYRAPLRGGLLRRIGTVSTLAPVTGADASPDGRLIALRTPLGVSLHRRAGGSSAAALAEPGCAVPLVDPRGEAVTFAADGAGLVAVSEGTRPALTLLRPPGSRSRIP